MIQFNYFQLWCIIADHEKTGVSMIIKREQYVNRLITSKHNNFIKVIVGIRRCGKSYLLFNLFKQHLLDTGTKEDHIIEIDLEHHIAANLVNPIELDKYIRSKIVSDGRMNYILIDEIQYCGKALPNDIDISKIHPDDQERMFVDFYRVLNGLRTTPNVDVCNWLKFQNARF
jgi:predicted AAA+ superfamily ATPase